VESLDWGDQPLLYSLKQLLGMLKQRLELCASQSKYFISEEGVLVRRNAYNLFKSLNVRRADLGLSQFDTPPAEPVWNPSPVGDLLAMFIDGKFSLKIRLDGPPAQHILLYAAAPVRNGVRYVNHFPLLGLLPPAKDGWSDITELYVARYGVPKPNWAIWVRTCQHIDGWTDVPKLARSRLPPKVT